MPDTQDTESGILRAMALHALAEGKKADLTTLQADVAEAISKADTKRRAAITKAENTREAAVEKATSAFNETRDAENARLGKAEAEAAQALDDLVTFQRKLREDTGAIIDLTAVPAEGAQVSL